MGTDSEGEVAGQGPRCCGPGEDLLPALEVEHHRKRRVLAVAVDVVHARLGVAQRGLTAPAVGENAETLIHVTLVEKGLERPHHALHVGRVEGFVVVLEVHPAGLAVDVAVPIVGKPQHAGTAGVIELVDTESGDLRVPADPQLLFGHHLGGKAVAVPTEPAVHLLAGHRAIPGYCVFHEAGEQVAIVGQPVGEGWAVVEHVLVGAIAPVDRGLEGVFGIPGGEDPALHVGERRLWLHIGIGHDCS